jgi:hypothetical protein
LIDDRGDWRRRQDDGGRRGRSRSRSRSRDRLTGGGGGGGGSGDHHHHHSHHHHHQHHSSYRHHSYKDSSRHNRDTSPGDGDWRRDGTNNNSNNHNSNKPKSAPHSPMSSGEIGELKLERQQQQNVRESVISNGDNGDNKAPKEEEDVLVSLGKIEDTIAKETAAVQSLEEKISTLKDEEQKMLIALEKMENQPPQMPAILLDTGKDDDNDNGDVMLVSSSENEKEEGEGGGGKTKTKKKKNESAAANGNDSSPEEEYEPVPQKKRGRPPKKGKGNNGGIIPPKAPIKPAGLQRAINILGSYVSALDVECTTDRILKESAAKAKAQHARFAHLAPSIVVPPATPPGVAATASGNAETDMMDADNNNDNDITATRQDRMNNTSIEQQNDMTAAVPATIMTITSCQQHLQSLMASGMKNLPPPSPGISKVLKSEFRSILEKHVDAAILYRAKFEAYRVRCAKRAVELVEAEALAKQQAEREQQFLQEQQKHHHHNHHHSQNSHSHTNLHGHHHQQQQQQQQSLQPPISPTFSGGGRTGARGRSGDIVRSDLEEKMAIMTLQAIELVRHMCDLPTQALLSDRAARWMKGYRDYNRLVEDPIQEEYSRALIRPWTDEEKRTFMERFLVHHKDFARIATFLPGRSVREIVQLYYQIQYSDEFSHTRRKYLMRKRRERAEENTAFRNGVLGMGMGKGIAASMMPLPSPSSLPDNAAHEGGGGFPAPAAAYEEWEQLGTARSRGGGRRGRGASSRPTSTAASVSEGWTAGTIDDEEMAMAAAATADGYVETTLLQAPSAATQSEGGGGGGGAGSRSRVDPAMDKAFKQAVMMHGKDLKAISAALGGAKTVAATRLFWSRHNSRLGLDQILVERTQQIEEGGIFTRMLMDNDDDTIMDEGTIAMEKVASSPGRGSGRRKKAAAAAAAAKKDEEYQPAGRGKAAGRGKNGGGAVVSAAAAGTKRGLTPRKRGRTTSNNIATTSTPIIINGGDNSTVSTLPSLAGLMPLIVRPQGVDAKVMEPGLSPFVARRSFDIVPVVVGEEDNNRYNIGTVSGNELVAVGDGTVVAPSPVLANKEATPAAAGLLHVGMLRGATTTTTTTTTYDNDNVNVNAADEGEVILNNSIPLALEGGEEPMMMTSPFASNSILHQPPDDHDDNRHQQEVQETPKINQSSPLPQILPTVAASAVGSGLLAEATVGGVGVVDEGDGDYLGEDIIAAARAVVPPKVAAQYRHHLLPGGTLHAKLGEEEAAQVVALLEQPERLLLHGDLLSKVVTASADIASLVVQEEQQQEGAYMSGDDDKDGDDDDDDGGGAGGGGGRGRKRRPGRPPSSWTGEEKGTFLAAFKAHGADWNDLQSALPTKTMTQIKGYYRNYRLKLGLDALAPVGSPFPAKGRGRRPKIKTAREQEHGDDGLIGEMLGQQGSTAGQGQGQGQQQQQQQRQGLAHVLIAQQLAEAAMEQILRTTTAADPDVRAVVEAAAATAATVVTSQVEEKEEGWGEAVKVGMEDGEKGKSG